MNRKPRQLTPVDLQILRSVNRFRYLTAAQLNRVLWPDNTRDDNRYAQRRLKRLVADEYLLPLAELPKPATGTAPRVHALSWRGRKTLKAAGEEVPSYYRPSEIEEAAHNALFMPHTLAVIDVLIAAEQLTSDVPGVVLEQLLLERELRRLHLTVTVPPTTAYAQSRRVTVVPDALFTMTVADIPQHFLLELDRGTERQQVWRDKIAALVLWVGAASGTTALLPSSYVTIAVVTPSERRRDYLRIWTAQELRSRGLFEDYAELISITDASPVAMSPQEFFTQQLWYPPFVSAPDSLIDLPDPDASLRSGIYRVRPAAS